MARSERSSPLPKAERLIHVRLKAETHRHLRVAAAEGDVTIQQWVEALIERELARLPHPSERRGRRG